MYPKILMPHPIFFGQRAHWNLGKVVVILSVIPAVSCSAELSLSAKTDNRLETPWSRIASVIRHYLVLNVLLSTEQILKK